jgi:hypothetical protein
MHATSLTRADQVLRVKNTTSVDQLLWIEPLGDRVILQSNVLYELIGTDEFGTLEVGDRPYCRGVCRARMGSKSSSAPWQRNGTGGVEVIRLN